MNVQNSSWVTRVTDAAEEYIPLMRTARLVNDNKPDWVANKIVNACSNLPEPKVCLLGLHIKKT